MSIRKILETVLYNYVEETNNEFKDNRIAKLLRSGLRTAVSNDLITGNIITKGSAGRGKWATAPWIAIFDAEISTSAAKGFDIVYLFSPDMSRVYLSLNQGWTFFNENYGNNAEKTIKKVASYWQNTLANRTDRMTIDPIDLTSALPRKNNLVTGYELGNIFSIKYERDNLPKDDQLLTDLKDMLFCLNEIKSDLINENDFKQNIDFILTQDLNLNPRLSNNSIKKIAKKLPDVTLIEESSLKETDKKGRKIDYVTLQKQNSMIGFLGEKIVLNYEQRKLKEYPSLSEKIKHVSQTRGDGLGFDILSFNTEGQEIYIEVKTTSQGKSAPFYMSDNEVNFAKKHPDNYVIYRVYNFTDLNEANDIEFFKLTGHDMENVELKPVSFLATVNNFNNRYD
ncbi:MrcB family domain-containing protein [Leuconostoc holzapfelii]|uniref:DUF3578 domain-containing protein n=1 Tax=Leuconostoc holzapfelii TaxID=434464 RepID=A0A846ZBK6_9LACO|nr:DUF3578 domain-containing protein [Leuconostoc holzapfelii]NKZ19187.1 DUF3578 domain-containing protein [Leuconostoc holzapfelii]